MARPLVLTVDWDFFPWNGGMAKSKRELSTGKGKVVEWLLYDWSCREGCSPWIDSAIWMSRALIFASCGRDMQAECRIREDRKCVLVETFLREIHRRYCVINRECDSTCSDSHTSAYTAVNSVYAWESSPVDVLMFDAHCDLGYCGESVKMTLSGRYDCSNWLMLALAENKVETATIVYPDWLGMKEWSRFRARKDIKVLLKQNRIKVFTWSQWLVATNKVVRRRDVRALNIVRSGSWVPPHLDHQFCDLLKSFPFRFHNSIEHGAVEPRDWSYPAVFQAMRVLVDQSKPSKRD